MNDSKAQALLIHCSRLSPSVAHHYHRELLELQEQDSFSRGRERVSCETLSYYEGIVSLQEEENLVTLKQGKQDQKR